MENNNTSNKKSHYEISTKYHSDSRKWVEIQPKTFQNSNDRGHCGWSVLFDHKEIQVRTKSKESQILGSLIKLSDSFRTR